MKVFYYGNPVPPERFIGRRRERERLIGLIAQHGQSAAIIGEPRIGKTSVLNYLASADARAEMAKTSGDRKLLFSQIDGQIIADEFDRARFWGYVFDPLEEDGVLASAGPRLAASYKACREKGFETTGLERLMGRLGEAGYRLVLLVDELDYLLEGRVATHPEFFAGLRSLTQRGTLTLVFASRLPLSRLNEIAADAKRMGSPYFNSFHEMQLGPFEADELSELLAPAADRFSDEDRSFLRDASGGHPYLVQVAAYWLLNGHEEGRSSLDARRLAVAELVRITEQTLSDTWRRWSPKMRYISASIAAAHLEAMGDRVEWRKPDGAAMRGLLADVEILRQEIDALRGRGFVTNHDTYRIRPIAFLSWLAVKLRSESQSSQLWSQWIQDESWETLLSPRRRETWEIAIRPRATAVRTDLETLLAANAALQRGEPAQAPVQGGAPSPSRPVRIFYHHAPEDEGHLDDLEMHLSAMKREGKIETWSARDLMSGERSGDRVAAEIDGADIVLLLLSSDFFGSDDCAGPTLERIQKRHDSSSARVIPIRLRPVDAGNKLWITSLEAVPGGKLAVTEHPNRDEAWREVVTRIRRVVDEVADRLGSAASVREQA